MKFCLIGGFGPESTLDYYKSIITKYREKHGDHVNPEFLVISLDVNKLLKIVGDKAYDDVTDYILKGIKEGHLAGAEFAAIGANTPHIVFDALEKLSPIPLISIVEATARDITHKDIKRVALLGTGFTMKEDFFKDVLKKHDVEPVVPSDDEQNYIHTKIMNELELGIVNSETKEVFIRIIQRLKKENDIEGVILGCTELPMILSSDDDKELIFFNTTEIHVRDIVEKM